MYITQTFDPNRIPPDAQLPIAELVMALQRKIAPTADAELLCMKRLIANNKSNIFVADAINYARQLAAQYPLSRH